MQSFYSKFSFFFLRTTSRLGTSAPESGPMYTKYPTYLCRAKFLGGLELLPFKGVTLLYVSLLSMYLVLLSALQCIIKLAINHPETHSSNINDGQFTIDCCCSSCTSFHYSSLLPMLWPSYCLWSKSSEEEEEGGDFLQTQCLREVRPSHQHSECKAVIRRGIIRRQSGVHAQADTLTFLAVFYACQKTSTIYWATEGW